MEQKRNVAAVPRRTPDTDDGSLGKSQDAKGNGLVLAFGVVGVVLEWGGGAWRRGWCRGGSRGLIVFAGKCGNLPANGAGDAPNSVTGLPPRPPLRSHPLGFFFIPQTVVTGRRLQGLTYLPASPRPAAILTSPPPARASLGWTL